MTCLYPGLEYYQVQLFEHLASVSGLSPRGWLLPGTISQPRSSSVLVKLVGNGTEPFRSELGPAGRQGTAS